MSPPSLAELKVMAYDLIRTIEACQARLRPINAAIAEAERAMAKEVGK